MTPSGYQQNFHAPPMSSRPVFWLHLSKARKFHLLLIRQSNLLLNFLIAYKRTTTSVYTVLITLRQTLAPASNQRV